MCTTGGVNVILEEHYRDICCIYNEHDAFRQDLQRVTDELQAMKVVWKSEKQALQEEVNTLRDALDDNGLLSHGPPSTREHRKPFSCVSGSFWQ
eukprot:1899516-Amphidinium_carterae.1